MDMSSHIGSLPVVGLPADPMVVSETYVFVVDILSVVVVS
jgi:hypothetical protein